MICVRFVIAVNILLAVGCVASNAVETSADQLPDPFTLEFRAFASGQRAVYYVLERDGRLRFGGGRHANTRQPLHDAGVLTPEQRLRVWRIIVEHKLLEARGQVFPKRQNVEYEFKVRAGSRSNELRAADDTVAGLDALDAALFEIQSKNRYDER